MKKSTLGMLAIVLALMFSTDSARRAAAQANATRPSNPQAAKLAPLFSSPARFISIQREVRAEDENMLAAELRVTHIGGELNDFDDTAAVVALCDLVIAVDTAVVHLAGAMGKPVWILLPFAADWRWLTDREDSPWYPTARLFRQRRIGEWDSVIDKVGRELTLRFK